MLGFASLLLAASTTPTSITTTTTPATTCKGTQVPGERECRDLIMWMNSTTPGVDDGACEKWCCADSALHPAPYPGAHTEGCAAWFYRAGHTIVGQCFICRGIDRHGNPGVIPPVNTTSCKNESQCTTGTVEPTPGPKPPTPPTVIPRIGTEGKVAYADGARESLRHPTYANGSGTPLNETTELTPLGWPMMDCEITIFDDRPTHAWAPPMDDPDHRQADYSGTWTLSIVGNATVELINAVGITLGAPSYDATANVMTQPIVFAKGGWPDVHNLLCLRFTGTRATPTSPAKVNGTGFVNMTVRRPGYGPTAVGKKSTQLFTDEWAQLLGIFDHVRWMGAVATSEYNWRCAAPNAASCSTVQWAERRTPDLAFFAPSYMQGQGDSAMPFEHVLLAANELNSDVWVNVPLTATSQHICSTLATDPAHVKCLPMPKGTTFVEELANLFKHGNAFTGNVGLKPGLKIYVEHSNEVWNYGFKQHSMNENFAEWEVLNASKSGGLAPGRTASNLDSAVQGRPDIEERNKCTNHTDTHASACWGKRRHARRTYEVAKTFERVFGPGSLNNEIRMVYASWGLQNNVQTYFNDTLTWLASEYGDVSKFLYGISYAQYFGPHSQNAAGEEPFNYSTATMPEVMSAFTNASLDGISFTQAFVALAKVFKVKTLSYEGGPGYHVGGEKPGSKGLNMMLEAARDVGMKAVVKQHVDTCWQFGWDVYNYFSSFGMYSTYGCWGAVESLDDLNPGPPKLQALYELTGTTPEEREAWAKDPERPRAVDPRYLQL